jgi:hypothetical protein
MVLVFFWLALVAQKKEGEGGERVPGHIISTTIGGKNGEPKRVSCDSLSCLSVCLSVCRAGVWMNVAAASARRVVSLLVWSRNRGRNPS